MLIAAVAPGAYWSAVLLTLTGGIVLALEARRRPGPWCAWAARALGALLGVVAISFVTVQATGGAWTARADLPVALCDAALVVGAVACWWPVAVLVELTWFWGLAGTLQGLLTPDLDVGPAHLAFWQYVLGHAGIVGAALLLVVGLRREPRPGSVGRVFVISALYTAFVGLVDAVTGADYMFLRRPPGEWTLLRLLGPWPWYIVSAAGVALVLFTILDMPFWPGRRRAGARAAV